MKWFGTVLRTGLLVSAFSHLASSCILVFTSQIGFVKEAEATPGGRKKESTKKWGVGETPMG